MLQNKYESESRKNHETKIIKQW